MVFEAWCYAANIAQHSKWIQGFGVCPFNPSTAPNCAFNLNITSQQSHVDTAMEVESCSNPGINVEMTNLPEPSRQEASSSNQALNLPQESEGDVTLPRISAETPTKVLNAISPIPRYQKTTLKRRKQHAALLTSSDNINKLRVKYHPTVASNHNAQKKRLIKKSKEKAVARPISSNEASSKGPLSLLDNSSDENFDATDECVRFGKDNFPTIEQSNWI